VILLHGWDMWELKPWVILLHGRDMWKQDPCKYW
jgi:hypothetical protein